MRGNRECSIREFQGTSLGICRPADLQNALGDGVEILDRRRCTTRDTDDPATDERQRIVQIMDGFNLDCRGPGDATQAREFLGVGRRPTTDGSLYPYQASLAPMAV